jgi:hypothetical protein
LKISGSRVRAFLVIIWTVFNSAGMLIFALSAYHNAGQVFLPRWDWLITQHSILGPLFISIWGLAALGLLHFAPKVGSWALLMFSAWNASTTGASLINDLVAMLDRMPSQRLNDMLGSHTYSFGDHAEIRGYVIRAAVIVFFLLTAAWCANRLFLRSPENRPFKVGVGVAVVALLIGVTPYVAKVFLLATIPPVQASCCAYDISEGTRKFLQLQIDQGREKMLSDCQRLAKHRPTNAEFHDCQRSVEMFGMLYRKLEESALASQKELDASYLFVRKMVEARKAALQRARSLQTRMMAGLTLITAAFLGLVLRSKQVPSWARYFSMIAMGAVLAGWFPL